MITSGYFGYKWPVARSVFGEAKDSQLQIWRGRHPEHMYKDMQRGPAAKNSAAV